MQHRIAGVLVSFAIAMTVACGGAETDQKIIELEFKDGKVVAVSQSELD